MTQFTKYSCTGNDFIFFDLRGKGNVDPVKLLSREKVAKLCHRQLGVGADGIILLLDHPECDAEFVVINSDGGIAEMCGNALRGVTDFLGKDTSQVATQNSIYTLIKKEGLPYVEMSEAYDGNKFDLNDFGVGESSFYINTGVPHALFEVSDYDEEVFLTKAREIRFDSRFGSAGSNVSFYKKVNESEIELHTYERGVEAETLSCGTGVMALGHTLREGRDNFKIQVNTPGGTLYTGFSDGQGFIQGSVERVYEGRLSEQLF